MKTAMGGAMDQEPVLSERLTLLAERVSDLERAIEVAYQCHTCVTADGESCPICTMHAQLAPGRMGGRR